MLAAGLLNEEESKRLAGVHHMTLAPDLLYALSKREEKEEEIRAMSLFNNARMEKEHARDFTSFLNDEDIYAAAFEKSYEGKGKWKTQQVHNLHFSIRIIPFC